MIKRVFGLALILLSGLSVNQSWADSSEMSASRQQEIHYIVRHDCGSCHGMTLKGGLGPAITAEAMQSKPEDYLFNTIRDGHPGTPMPPWLGIFTESEIHYLVNLLKRGDIDT